ncbi:hypothetical protein ACFQVA_08070 [Actinomadura keratinilytica]
MAALFGRRMRRGAASTAVAAAAMAALSASGAPSAVSEQPAAAAADRPSAGAPGQEDPSITGDSPYYTELPDLKGPGRNDPPDETPTTGSAESGIPATVLDAYRKAEASSPPATPLPRALGTPRRHRQGGVRPRPRRPPRRRRHHALPDPRPRPQRRRLRQHLRHRRRRLRRRHPPRPRRRPHAVHPADLGELGPRRQRRRQA